MVRDFAGGTSVCSPARASLLTGRIPSQHGVIDWIRQGSEAKNGDTPVEYLKGMAGFSDVLHDNGYDCGLIGKWHLGDSARPQKGFTHWITMPKGSDSYYGARIYRDGAEEVVPGYLTDFLADEAVSYLDARAGSDRPFFLSLNFSAPHRPWAKAQHPGDVWHEYDDCPFETFPKLPRHPHQINNGVYPQEDVDEMIQGYCTSLTAADAAIGRVLEQLRTLGLEEDTLIVFTSDNGMSLGHHGIYGKGKATYPQNMYDQAVRVPFLMAHPGRITPRASSALISHYDFCQTLLDYLGIDAKVAENLPGKSFVRSLTEADDTQDTEVVVFDEYGPVRMLRDSRWKFVWRKGDWPNEPYDMVADPEEMNDLIASPDHAEIAAALEQRIANWFRQYVVPARDATKQPVYGRGQIAPVDAETDGEAFADDWFYQSSGGVDPGPTL
ncbi:sulfatase [Marinovum sp.]|uniref:sulfatase family protein n=1 Tax=Marinovum sp. TaxID=2024839 RepID=UPI002B275C7D|nr:sulfatase-like hydrolase/transferase [Marinovum sp.]